MAFSYALPANDIGLVNVKHFGAKGDGATNDTAAIQAAIDYCFGSSASPHGINYYLNRVLFFPPGHFRADNLLFTKLQGARIMGSGRFVTTIESVTANAAVFRTNGAGYCHFEGLHLKGSGTATVFDLDYDGSGGGAALQSNTFVDMFFQGGSYGMNIAASTYMGSENLFLNCFWISNTAAGVVVSASNALQQTFIGGNFQGCGHGIWIAAGSVPVIQGVGFQLQTGYDIRMDNSSLANTMLVSGCRSESTNFYYGGAGVTLENCGHTSGTSTEGDFAVVQGGAATISACYSTHGRVLARYSAHLRVQSSVFDRNDWFAANELWYIPNNNVDACVELENIWYGTGDGILIKRRRITADPDGGATDYLSYDYDVGAPGTFTRAEASHLAFGTTTGTKIGTATNQKLAFYNATPVVQGASVADATDAATAITQLNALISRIEALGLIATV